MSLPVTIVLPHKVQNESINYNRTIFVSEINLFFVLFSLLHGLWVVVVVGSGEAKKGGILCTWEDVMIYDPFT